MAHDAAHGAVHGHDASGGFEHHIVPPKTYFLVFIALMVLLVITLAVAVFDLGFLNVAVAMTVAVIKVALIMTYFMHLKWNTPLVRFFAIGALFFLVIMFVLTLADYVSRGWLG